jgi:hypothetical protein
VKIIAISTKSPSIKSGGYSYPAIPAFGTIKSPDKA